jgi:hypothetical protein
MHLYFLLPLCSSYVLNDDDDDILYICVCVMLLLLFRSIQQVTPSGLLRSSLSHRIYFFFFFFRILKTFDATHKIFKLFFGTKKKQKIHPKNRHIILSERALIGWLVATELHLSLSSSSSSSFVASRGGTKRCGVTRRRRKR